MWDLPRQNCRQVAGTEHPPADVEIAASFLPSCKKIKAGMIVIEHMTDIEFKRCFCGEGFHCRSKFWQWIKCESAFESDPNLVVRGIDLRLNRQL